MDAYEALQVIQRLARMPSQASRGSQPKCSQISKGVP